jgi:hypothetical protein
MIIKYNNEGLTCRLKPFWFPLVPVTAAEVLRAHSDWGLAEPFCKLGTGTFRAITGM